MKEAIEQLSKLTREMDNDYKKFIEKPHIKKIVKKKEDGLELTDSENNTWNNIVQRAEYLKRMEISLKDLNHSYRNQEVIINALNSKIEFLYTALDSDWKKNI